MAKPKNYTVVGLYEDNKQTYIGWIEAVDVKDAVSRGRCAMEKNSSAGGSVLAVFKGKHKDLYGEDELIEN